MQVISGGTSPPFACRSLVGCNHQGNLHERKGERSDGRGRYVGAVRACVSAVVSFLRPLQHLTSDDHRHTPACTHLDRRTSLIVFLSASKRTISAAKVGEAIPRAIAGCRPSTRNQNQNLDSCPPTSLFGSLCERSQQHGRWIHFGPTFNWESFFGRLLSIPS